MIDMSNRKKRLERLIELAQVLPRARNYNFAVAEEGGKVIFLRRIVPGGADKSYGIHVAQLAGLPKSVVHRAREVLEELERDSRRTPAKRSLGSRRPKEAASQQLPLMGQESPLSEELEKLDIDSLTPLEALTKLYELRQKAKEW